MKNFYPAHKRGTVQTISIFFIYVYLTRTTEQGLSTRFQVNTSLSPNLSQKFGFDVGLCLIPFPRLLYLLDSIGTGLEKDLVPKKVSELVSFRFLGLVTHCFRPQRSIKTIASFDQWSITIENY